MLFLRNFPTRRKLLHRLKFGWGCLLPLATTPLIFIDFNATTILSAQVNILQPVNEILRGIVEFSGFIIRSNTDDIHTSHREIICVMSDTRQLFHSLYNCDY